MLNPEVKNNMFRPQSKSALSDQNQLSLCFLKEINCVEQSYTELLSKKTNKQKLKVEISNNL